MRKLALFFLCCFGLVSQYLFSQELAYIFIETQPKQAFTIEMNGKKYPSNAKSEVWLTNLKPGTYTLFSTITGVSGVQKFAIPVQQKPVGLQLKKEANNAWRLYAIAAPAWVKPPTAMPTKQAAEEASNEFAEMLAEVVGKDAVAKPAIKVTAKTEPPAPVPTPKATEKVSAEEQPATAQKDTAETEQQETNTQGVVLANDVYNGTDRQLTFVAFNGNVKDTVLVQLSTPVKTDSISTKKYTAAPIVETPTLTATTVATQVPLVDTITQPKVKAVVPVADTTKAAVANPFFNAQKVAETPTPVTVQRVNNCSEKASDADFQRLRKRIVANGIEKEMTEIARKQMVQKCYSTTQIGLLGNMFLSDDGRYQFFSMAISFVQDVENYSTLKTQLLDENYKSKFDSLLRGK